jgi:predicted O-methyltransferase YrrM
MDNTIFEKVDAYISGLLATEDKALVDTIASLKKNDIPDISVSANQGKLLQVLALACNAKRILELGTFAGYSTIWLARSLPADGKVVTIEFDKRHAELAAANIQNAGLASKVDIRLGSAMDVLQKLEEENAGPFDMIFIDADKPPYAEYFKMALKLSRPGTLIVADNVIRNAQVLDPGCSDEKVQGVQRFNKVLAECTEVSATILQTVGIKEYDGIAIAVVNR